MKKAGGARIDDVDDLRALSVVWTKQGERNKDWESVIELAMEESFEDWPLTGPRTTMWLGRHVLRNGGTPGAFLSQELRDMKMAENDRSAHELEVLLSVLEMSGSTDQLNIGNTCALELVSRRIQLILDATGSGGAACQGHCPIAPGAPDAAAEGGGAGGAPARESAGVPSVETDSRGEMSRRGRAAGVTRPPPWSEGSAAPDGPRNFGPGGLAGGFSGHGALPRSAADASPRTLGEVFPLPWLPEEPPPLAGLARGTAQRVGRRRHLVSEFTNTLETLNGVAGAPQASEWAPVGQCHQEAWEDARNARVEYGSAPPFERR